MSMRPLSVLVGLSTISALLVAAGGCNQYLSALLLVSQVEGDPFVTKTVIGGDEARLMFLRTPPPEGYNPLLPLFGAPVALGVAETWPLPKNDLVAVDLRTLALEPILTDFEASMYWPVSDRRWLAWADHLEKTLRVRELESGSESRFLEGQAEAGAVQPLALDAGRLVVSASGSGSSAEQLVVIELPTGEQNTVATFESYALLPGDIVLEGDLLAFPVHAASEPEGQDSLSVETHIDLIDLDTGERRTIATDTVGGPLGIVGGRVFWVVESTGTGLAEVRGYDPQTGETATILTFDTETDGRQTYAVDIGEPGLLLSSVGNDASSLGGQTEAYVLQRLDGTSTTFYEYTYSLAGLPFYAEPPEFVGSFVVFRDAYNGDYWVFDAVTGTQRQLEPFPE
jgi:hypothetical protein